MPRRSSSAHRTERRRSRRPLSVVDVEAAKLTAVSGTDLRPGGGGSQIRTTILESGVVMPSYGDVGIPQRDALRGAGATPVSAVMAGRGSKVVTSPGWRW